MSGVGRQVYRCSKAVRKARNASGGALGGAGRPPKRIWPGVSPAPAAAELPAGTAGTPVRYHCAREAQAVEHSNWRVRPAKDRASVSRCLYNAPMNWMRGRGLLTKP